MIKWLVKWKQSPAMIHLTENAIRRIRHVVESEPNVGGLRMGVRGGGCSGLTYTIKFDTEAHPRDNVFEFEGVKIFVDPKSMVFLDGMTLDWKDSLIHSGFEFDNPHAKKSCGCGTSFSA